MRNTKIIIWTPDFAYAVGLITTDGNLSNDGRHLEFTSKDIEQINNFKSILELNNKISMKSSSYAKQNTCYRIQFGNVKLYRFLLSIGLHPNKSKTMGKLNVPDLFFRDFLRGFLDGDGFTNSYWDKRWKKSFMLYIGFVSASKQLLIWIKNNIESLYHIKGTIKYSGRSTDQLIYAKNSSLKLLKIIYYNDGLICLSRKKFKIDKALGIIQNMRKC